MSKLHTLALASLLALVSASLVAPAAAAESRTFNVTGHVSDAGEFYFTFEGIDGQNPTVPVNAGDSITIKYKTASNVHNFHVGAPVNLQTDIKGPDAEEQTLTFTVPSSAATIDYWCDPHKGSGMAGKFQVQGATGGNGEEPKESPGFEAVLALAGVAAAVLLVRRRA